MTQLNWKLLAGILAVGLVALLVLRFTRRVAPYQPPPDQKTANWGTLDSQTAASLQSILDREVNALKVPGLQAHVRTANGLTWSGVSGTVDLARRLPLRRDHVLRVGSTTKTFTAVIVLQLVEAGALSLDDPLSNWFPEFPNGEDITVRQLLNHTSGIPEFLQSPEVIMKSIIPSIHWRPEDLIAIALKNKPAFAPGEGWSYSNTNYILLGRIAERITGRTSAQLMRERIMDPLRLENTFFVPDESAPPSLATGYDRDLSRFPGMLDITPSSTSWATAAFTSGALASTADDLGIFYNALFEGRLLSAASMNEMLTFVTATNPGFEEQDGYGLGLMRIHSGGTEFVGHVGEFMGSTAIAMHASQSGDLVVVTTNLSFPNVVATLGALYAGIAH